MQYLHEIPISSLRQLVTALARLWQDQAVPNTVVNGYFTSQAITGQQRYAVEMTRELFATRTNISMVKPSQGVLGKRTLEWAEMQLRLPRVTRNSQLLSLTSRAPVGARSHVVTIHDTFVLTNPEWFSRNYRQLHQRVLRHQLKSAAGLVAVSEPVAHSVSELVSPSMPLVVAPNGVTSLPPPVVPTEIPREVAAAEPILAVGSLEPRKNLKRLIEAFMLLPPSFRAAHPLVVVGSVAAAFAQEDLTAGKYPTVHFLGRVPDSELAYWYARCHVFASVSLDEGFGIPLIEAASAGVRRLLVSDIAAYRWILDGHHAKFVDPRDVNAIAQHLQLCADADGRDFSTLENRFTWAGSAQTLAEFLDQVA